ncbi:hypothetical protein [uncultured Enterococcus sp.]|uniref:hypothetical protein n=1 Tax=uncultured Enterococcus sp. TaxID=167972 RepID=UPI002AA61A73|nr:hypothetical protein [uncultured Enterococcus sp.]
MTKEFITVSVPEFHGDREWYEKELKDRLRYHFGQTNGSYSFPNSMEGDLLIMTLKLLLLLEKESDGTKRNDNAIPADLQLSAIQFSVMHLMNMISDIEKIIADSSEPDKIQKWEQQQLEYQLKLQRFNSLHEPVKGEGV